MPESFAQFLTRASAPPLRKPKLSPILRPILRDIIKRSNKMATSSLNLTNNAVNDSEAIPFTSENIDARVYLKPATTPDTQPKVTLLTGNFQKFEESEEGKEFTLVISQSIKTYKASTLDGIKQLLDNDEEEAVNIFNRGLAQKFNQKLNSNLKELDAQGQPVFQPTDLVDSIEWIREATKRSTMTPTEKAVKALAAAGFTPETIAAMFAAV
jgi:hypothetical protein